LSERHACRIVEAQTQDGRKLSLMTLIDEFTREFLAIRVARRINSSAASRRWPT
jgi:hypothetical protein